MMERAPVWSLFGATIRSVSVCIPPSRTVRGTFAEERANPGVPSETLWTVHDGGSNGPAWYGSFHVVVNTDPPGTSSPLPVVEVQQFVAPVTLMFSAVTWTVCEVRTTTAALSPTTATMTTSRTIRAVRDLRGGI